jgi:predicted nucleic acid-binding protein
MRENVAYLDSSAIIKRYVREEGGEHVRRLYLAAYTGEVRLAFSIWNVGEVLGALDKARRKGLLSNHAYAVARGRFLSETRRMAKLGILIIVPLSKRVVAEAWKYIEKHHIYQADAVQLASAKKVACREFVTGDRELHQVALSEGLKSVYLG